MALNRLPDKRYDAIGVQLCGQVCDELPGAKAMMERLKKEGGIVMVVVQYAQIIEIQIETRDVEVTHRGALAAQRAKARIDIDRMNNAAGVGDDLGPEPVPRAHVEDCRTRAEAG